MNIEIITVLAFLFVMSIVIYRDRKNFEFKSGLILRRSTKGKEFIYRFAEKNEKALKIIGTVGIVIGILASFYGSYLLFKSTFDIFSTKTKESTLRLVLPSVEGVNMPGFVLGVPFWYWIIAVFVVMFIHEPMHAFLARAEKIDVKSFGLLLFIILPGAFVEPNERQLKRKPLLSKLRVFAAGSFGNILAAGIMILLIIGFNKIVSVFISPAGIGFESLIAGSYAEDAELNGLIVKINGIDVKTLGDLSDAMKDVKPGDEIQVTTTKGTYNIKTISDPENEQRALIGIQKPYVEYMSISNKPVSKSTISVIEWFDGLFAWIFILNLGVGVFNLFPLKPLDGGLMMEAIAQHFFKDKGKTIANYISIFFLLLILFNLFGPKMLTLLKI
ncbi:MAG: site-2 protease family protein [Candidatus Aenigmatarchaeota archaeon]